MLNAIGMKEYNQRKILNKLRVNSLSRAELARQTGLTRAAIGVLADHLIEKEIIVEGKEIVGQKGRKSVELQLNSKRYYAIGISIERTGYAIGVIDFTGKVKEVRDISEDDYQYDIETILKNIYRMILEMRNIYDSQGELLGIGITSPGPLDISKGTILNPPNFHKWSTLKIVDYFQDKLKCPVYLENDLNGLALAEKYFGVGNQYNNYIVFSIDHGLGSGTIINGEIYVGSSGFGSNFGHITVDMNGKICDCGNRGCIELYASLPNILSYARQINEEFIKWEIIIDKMIEGDESAKEIVEKECEYLSILFTTAMNIMDVDGIILSGKLCYKGEKIRQILEEKVNTFFIGRKEKYVPIVMSTLTENANILSSGNIVLEHFFKNVKL